MAAAVGRQLVIKKGAAAIATVQSKSVEFNGSPIDITSDDDAGWQKMLNTAGVSSISISCDGVASDTTLRDIAETQSRLMTDITIVFPDGKIIACDFYLDPYTENGDHADAIKFSASFTSSGTPVITPAP